MPATIVCMTGSEVMIAHGETVVTRRACQAQWRNGHAKDCQNSRLRLCEHKLGEFMRSLICSTLIAVCLYQTAFAQTSEEPSGDFAYAIPEGWTGQKYPDGIVYVSPVFNNGEKCVLTVFEMRPTSGNLENDASNVFREVFNTDPFQNSSYPYPSPTLGKGISPQGWAYFIIKKSIRGQVGDYGSLLGVTVFVAKAG